MQTATMERTAAPLDLQLEPGPIQLMPQSSMVLPARTVTPADLLRIAVESGDQDIARLERLMQLDAQWREREERDRTRTAMLAFRRDFAAFRGENIVIPKTRFVDRGKAGSFWQAEFGAVMRMLSPSLFKHGFGVRHDQRFGSRKWVGPVVEGGDAVEHDIPWVWVTCFLEHKDGHAERLDLEGPPGEAHANTPTQNMQVTASYLKRQAALAITGTATEDEDDESKLRKIEAIEQKTAEVKRSLLDEGKERALEGTAALNGWWGKLSSKERKELNSDFGALRRAAAAADKAGKGQQP